MKTEWKNIITRELNEYPVEINSSLLSAQSRPRLYWANWLIRKPKDKHILFKDIVEDDGWVKTDKFHCITRCYNHNVGKEEYMERREKIGGFCSYVWLNPNNQTYKLLAEKDIEYEKLYSIECNRSKQFGIGINENKAYCLTKRMLTGLTYKGKVRLLTPLECERLQTLPENYTKYGINKETNQIEEIRKTKRYETIGNGWTIDVIVHIFKEMVENKKVLRLF